MTIQILSLLIALLAVLVGPILTYKKTKQQFEFQFRTSIKEHWVNSLEIAAHSFLLSTMEWIERYPALREASNITSVTNNEIDKMLKEINSSIIKLQLLLDEIKEEQKTILDNVTQIKSIVNKKEYDHNTIQTLRNHHDKIISTLKIIFHNERTKIAKLFR